MILPDTEIAESIRKREIIIEPFKKENIGPCSIDLTLGTNFKLFTNEIDSLDPNSLEDIEKNTLLVERKGRPFIIKPGQFILGVTEELIGIPKHLAGTLEGRSSVARMGIMVHAAGLLNPGAGIKDPMPIVLEIFCQNSSPVKLHPGMRIAQLMFNRLNSPASKGYDELKSSRYSGQKKPILFKEK